MTHTDPARYRHRIEEVEAVRWTGDNEEQLRAFMGDAFYESEPEPGYWVVKIGDDFYEESPADFAKQFAPAVSGGVSPAADSPSRRAGLRDEIVNALGRIKTIPPVAHRREQADHVLAVLYREWPWLRAEAEDAAVLPAATVLLEAADRLWALANRTTERGAGVLWAAEWLRRLAAGPAAVGAGAATTPDTEAVCVCGHPMRLHHEDVCLTECGCNDGREPEETADLPERLAAALTARFTELGNPYSAMRRHEQGPDGWPASHPVGPKHVAAVLRELLDAAPPAGGAPRTKEA